MYVFAEFYEELFRSKVAQDDVSILETAGREVSRVEVVELQQHLRKMKKRKASDSRGFIIEMIQLGGDKLLCTIAQVFTDILAEKNMPPEY